MSTMIARLALARGLWEARIPTRSCTTIYNGVVDWSSKRANLIYMPVACAPGGEVATPLAALAVRGTRPHESEVVRSEIPIAAPAAPTSPPRAVGKAASGDRHLHRSQRSRISFNPNRLRLKFNPRRLSRERSLQQAYLPLTLTPLPKGGECDRRLHSSPVLTSQA